ncbi:MAG: DNA-directed RNA polymerase subunit alpha [Candidatus Uhrbacteria bacterium]
MEQFILPSRFAWQDGTKPNERTVTIEPCYFGYGTTLGNALRRVLLSSLEGAAVTAVKIDGAAHEFSALPHVQEDVIEILLNMKQLRLKVFADEPVRLTLEAKGKREVTAADIAPNSAVEIVNSDLHIATLTHRDATIHMEIIVQRGRGYSSTESRGKQKLELGTMTVDAVFTPIRNVGHRVENTRVGEITNYDRLVLTIETDGSITPEEALNQAAKFLVDHFAIILNPSTAASATVSETVVSEEAVEPIEPVAQPEPEAAE